MTTAITNTLRVPGAQLHYEVRGSGPQAWRMIQTNSLTLACHL